MRIRVAAALIALAALAVGCSRPKASKVPSTPVQSDSSSGAEPRVSPSETVLTGKVVAGGLAASPATSLEIEGGKPTTLVGPLEPELRRLGGATVWVTGAPVASGPSATFSVTRYEIVAIDGAKPMVGRLVARSGATWIASDRDTVELKGAPRELTAKAGAKVWIIGRRSGKEMTTQTYGIIRDP